MRELYTEVRTTKDGKEYRVNGATVFGNLTKDVPPAKEVEVKGEKKLVLNSLDVRIAVNYNAPKEDGTGWEEKVEFYPFTLWGARGKYFQTLKKGDGITVKGYLKEEIDTYEKEGKVFSNPKTTLIIDNFSPVRRTSASVAKKEGTEEEMKIDGEEVPF